MSSYLRSSTRASLARYSIDKKSLETYRAPIGKGQISFQCYHAGRESLLEFATLATHLLLSFLFFVRIHKVPKHDDPTFPTRVSLQGISCQRSGMDLAQTGLGIFRRGGRGSWNQRETGSSMRGLEARVRILVDATAARRRVVCPLPWEL